MRAFALCSKVYNYVRVAVKYLRDIEGKGDAEFIAPSLYAGRARPSKPAEEDGETNGESTDTEIEADSQVGAVVGPAPAAPFAAGQGSTRVGMPGSSPFTE